jgi:hypothetical protein
MDLNAARRNVERIEDRIVEYREVVDWCDDQRLTGQLLEPVMGAVMRLRAQYRGAVRAQQSQLTAARQALRRAETADTPTPAAS